MSSNSGSSAGSGALGFVIGWLALVMTSNRLDLSVEELLLYDTYFSLWFWLWYVVNFVFAALLVAVPLVLITIVGYLFVRLVLGSVR